MNWLILAQDASGGVTGMPSADSIADWAFNKGPLVVMFVLFVYAAVRYVPMLVKAHMEHLESNQETNAKLSKSYETLTETVAEHKGTESAALSKIVETQQQIVGTQNQLVGTQNQLVVGQARNTETSLAVHKEIVELRKLNEKTNGDSKVSIGIVADSVHIPAEELSQLSQEMGLPPDKVKELATRVLKRRKPDHPNQ